MKSFIQVLDFKFLLVETFLFQGSRYIFWQYQTFYNTFMLCSATIFSFSFIFQPKCSLNLYVGIHAAVHNIPGITSEKNSPGIIMAHGK